MDYNSLFIGVVAGGFVIKSLDYILAKCGTDDTVDTSDIYPHEEAIEEAIERTENRLDTDN